MSLLTVLGGIAAGAWLIVLILPWQPHRTRERIAAAAAPADLSGVTVLIPARNEASHIGQTLEALAQQGGNLEVIVIDDRSSDATADIVAEFAAKPGQMQVQLLHGSPLPPGWGGKLWALEQGLGTVERPWCLLLDADISLSPHLIPAMLQTAKQDDVALVSVMAKLRCRTVWERLLVPPFIFFFKLLYPFSLAANPRSRVAAAAGGCILVSTEVLRRIGAFSKWADALIDDCTLARHVKRSDENARNGLRLLMSHDVVSTRGYTQLREFWQMVTRTAFTQLNYSFLLLITTSIVMAVVFAAPIAAVWVGGEGVVRVLGLTALGAMIAGFWPVARFYDLPFIWRLTLPVSAALFLAMTWHSALNYYSGTRATWKSRHYESKT
jgi:hopene-associated glycosyltransferase HpnB